MDKLKKSPDSGKKKESKLKPKAAEYSQDQVSHHEVQYLTRCTRFRLSTEYELSICNCKHIMRMTIGERHSVVNPQKWLCNMCCTTESVWACLSCPNVACGRYIHEHALNHYLESRHPLVIDVNELYVYCYECEEYVLNDNKSGDIKMLRETLQAIRYQNFTGTTRSGHTLRTAAISADEDVQMRRRLQQQQLDRDDRTFTAIWHSRFVRQRKAFRHWLHCVKHPQDYANAESLSDENAESLSDESDKLALLQADLKMAPSNYVISQRLVSTSTLSISSQTTTLLNSDVKDSTKVTDITTGNICSVAEKETFPVGEPDKNRPAVSTTCCSPIKIAPSNSATVPMLFNTEEVATLISSETIPDSCVLYNENKSLSDDGDARKLITGSDPINQSINKDIPSPSVIVMSPEHSEKLGEITNVVPNESNSTPLILPETKTEPMLHEVNGENLKCLKLENVQIKGSAAPQLTHELQGRPKRANAASRYKEIMTYLSSPLQTVEPPKKRLLTDRANSSKIANDTKILPSVATRRSLRLIAAKNIKEAREAKQRKASKQRRKSATKRCISKNRTVKSSIRKPKRNAPTRPLPNNRARRHSVAPQSFYDNVPNRAVASLIPGVTGLRNLGNTCYLNSIIQVLGHLQKFRRCLLAVRDLEIDDSSLMLNAFQPPMKSLHLSARRSTIEMYEDQTNVSRRFLRMQAGLNGGRESGSENQTKDVTSSFNPEQRLNSSNSLSLCHELHDLYHIMWSGKWKLVSPCHFLSSVWQLIPSFRGYSQQDAQEFLCELLDKIVSELERRRRSPSTKTDKLAARISGVVHAVFEGRLHSQVRCLECHHISSTYEPFWDLSLEFPERYHSIANNSWKNTNQGCSLAEMLDKFTAVEQLDGGRVYNCSYCNNSHSMQPKGPTRRRRLSSRISTQKFSEAEKQIKIIELPQILRFHLKRFRWSGRNHREKISVPVNFPSELDMKPHCWPDSQNAFPGSILNSDGSFIYDLSAVVIHHGRGFGSGHYTAYCWNDIGKFWVHCNDSNLELCSIDDVMSAQAYILFYSQRGLDPHPHLFTPPPTPDISPPTTPDQFAKVFDDHEGIESHEKG